MIRLFSKSSLIGTIVNVKLKCYMNKGYRDVQLDTERQLADDTGGRTRCRAGSRDAGQLADVNSLEVDPMPMPLDDQLDRGWMSCL